MANVLIAPELEMFPNRKRWTAAECAELAAEGRLVGRYELLDGEIVSKMGQNPPHALTLTLAMRVLAALFGLDFLRIQSPITLPEPDGVYNEPEPDLAVTQEATTEYADRHPGPDDLRLVVEVADTTLRTDLVVKALLYARSGIPAYWVVDVVNRCLYLHHAPTPDGYAEVRVLAETETVTFAEHPDKPVTVRDLLPQQED
jgi:Uma2 family endonuclease